MGLSDVETKAECPRAVVELVARFAEHREAYQRQTYNETQARREFIDPFFSALGWDVDNRSGLAEAYKDVIHEDAIKVGGASKAPDYCFRIGGTRKFFVEAKKPAVGVGDDPGPAYQVRRYAWSNKLPLSIVTDFEEFAVYDCRIPPKAKDKASVARVMYLTCDKYAAKWGEIDSIFSKDAILKGSFDKYAESNRRKKGTAEVDEEILKEIEAWREALAKNFALRNERLSVRDLNFAVERTIDRIIFLRMCEDRSIEQYGRLQGLLNGTAIYGRLAQLFREADDKYNAGLFYFRQEAERGPPDELTLGLDLDDKVLKEIIVRLYYPESPYEFSVLPPEILGQVYEQFLGKVIRLTAGHRAVVEEKPEVRKAGGVYYTPTYIVEYIVKNTVGKLLEGKTPPDVGPERETKSGKRRKLAKGAKMLRILDLACGSGSFLLGAYQYLLDWHRDWYVADGPEKHKERVYQGAGGQWRLSIREKKRILLNNIYGVDIDAQAVEVTKLALLLKVLEGETAESIGSTMRLFQERALPDLSDNIKCGNSLIGPDFYEGRQVAMFDEEERYRINAFDWKAEFPEAFDAGGFDAVIGNPPYVQIENIEMENRKYFLSQYGEDGKLGKRYDIYQIFLMRSITLLRAEGKLGFILPNTFLMGHSYTILRERICSLTRVDEIVDLPQGVFLNVTVDNVLIFVDRETDRRLRDKNVIRVNKLLPRSKKSRVATSDWDESFQIKQSQLREQEQFKINVHTNPWMEKLFEKLMTCSTHLGELTDSSQGIILYKTAADAVRSKHTGFERAKGWKKLLRGKNIGRYHTKWAGEYVNYGSWLWCHREERFFASPKILLHAMRNKSLSRRLVGTLDGEQHYNAHNLANIISKEGSPYDLHFILGVFNSALLNFWYKAHFPNVNINPSDFRQLPIRRIDFSTASDRSRHDSLVGLVKQILTLHKSFVSAKTEHEKTSILRQIEATDGQIDRLVYELYGLTEEEIRIVEEGTK